MQVVHKTHFPSTLQPHTYQAQEKEQEFPELDSTALSKLGIAPNPSSKASHSSASITRPKLAPLEKTGDYAVQLGPLNVPLDVNARYRASYNTHSYYSSQSTINEDPKDMGSTNSITGRQKWLQKRISMLSDLDEDDLDEVTQINHVNDL